MSRFVSIFGLALARSGDHFTFAGLVDAPNFSLPGGTFLGVPTTVVYEGEPWEVMRENRLVYDVNLGKVVPLDSITQRAVLTTSGNIRLAGGMIQPGSVMDDGSRVTDYAAFYNADRGFLYSEVASA